MGGCVTPDTCSKLSPRTLFLLSLVQEVARCASMKNVYQRHTPNFGADWITSGFTPNICSGLRPLGLDITRVSGTSAA
jgi:hypothetical protein